MRSLEKWAVAAVTAAVLTVGAATAAAAVQAGTYVGKTTGNQPVRLTVVAGRVSVIRWTFRARCQASPNATYTNGVRARNIAIHSRRFTRGAVIFFTGPGGRPSKLVFGLAGRFFSPGKVIGAYDLRVTIKNANGTVFDRCTSSRKWSASR